MHAARKTMAKGFTLVEILIVVVILGILAAIVVPQFTNAANDARTGNVSTQVSTIESQLELFAARNNGSYPDLTTAGEQFSDLVTAGYFKEIPVNPFTGASSIVADDGTLAADGSITEVTVAGSTAGWMYESGTGNIAAIRP